MRRIFDEYGWAETALGDPRKTPGLQGATNIATRARRALDSTQDALVAGTSAWLEDLLVARGMCELGKPLPSKIRVEGRPVLSPLDLSHIPEIHKFNSQGLPIAFVDARNIDFGHATFVGDWSHVLFAQSNLSGATLAGTFHRPFLNGAFVNQQQLRELSVVH